MEGLIHKLRQHAVDIDVVDDQIKLNIPDGVDVSALIAEVRQHKEALISFIRKSRNTPGFKKIMRSPAKDHYALSSAQKRLYFLYEFEKESVTYNMPQVVRLDDTFIKEGVKEAFDALVARHEILRTSFEMIDGSPVQRPAEHIDFNVEFFSAPEEEVQAIIQSFIRPFDLGVAPLIRAGLIQVTGGSQMPDGHQVLMVDMHHIVTDGISNGILIKDIMALYHKQALPTLKLQYKDYAEWQQGHDEQQAASAQKVFWLDEFNHEPTVLDLPTDFPRPSAMRHTGNYYGFSIRAKETDQLKAIAEGAGATLFMAVLSVYTILLSKLANQEDIVVGTPVAGRPHADLENMIGMFVNTLPLRNYPLGHLTFRQFLDTVKLKTVLCFDNQSYPYEALIETLKLARDVSRNPLFDVFFRYQYGHAGAVVTSPEVQETPGLGTGYRVSKFDLTLEAVESAGALTFNFEYSTELFSKETIQRFATYFQRIVSAIVADPDVRLSAIDMLPSPEKAMLMKTWNDTAVPYPQSETIVSLFRQQAERTPEVTALICENGQLTYREVDHRSDKLAQYLVESCHIQGGDRIGLLLEREEYLILSVLGIMKTGCAYVPIDPSYPSDRIKAIVADAGLNVIITRGKHMVAGVAGQIDLDEVSAVIDSLVVKPACMPVNSSDLAYVIYTSGSTGMPKGVMVEHHSVVNRIVWMQKMYPLGVGDVILQKTPVTFDVSVWELFWWSFTGASVCLLTPGGEKDPQAIIAAVRKNRITAMHFVPSMLDVFLSVLGEDFDYSQLSSLRYVFTSGEALKASHVNRYGKQIHRHCGSRLINLYGPTEATVDVSYYECSFDTETVQVPIGKPIDNTCLYILDKDNQLCPVGVAGELCIGGVGLARGYLNQKELTSEKFIRLAVVGGERLYRTGDIAKWLPDENILYMGRVDNQVKIRGFRIELGEIEYQLLKNEYVNDVVIVSLERDNDHYLVAYYTGTKEIDPAALSHGLRTSLPEYMIPAHFIFLEKLPLTPNGKIDRKKLPDPIVKGVGNYRAPSNDIEKALVSVWSEILKIDEVKIGVDDSFFALGGHSLSAMILANRIFKKFEVHIPLQTLFKQSDIFSLGKIIVASLTSVYRPIQQAASKPHYGLSSAQKRLYFVYEFDPNSIAYNVTQLFTLEGVLNQEKLRDSFGKLIARHEILRTCFQIVDGEPVQIISAQADFSIEILRAAVSEVPGVIEKFVRPFDLAVAPLIRVGVVEHLDMNPKVYTLAVDIHHMVIDGVSMRLLFDDFTSYYNDEMPEPLTLQFKDYAEWQKEPEQQEEIKRQRDFWISEFSSPWETLDLPVDLPRPAVKDTAGASVTFGLDADVTTKLKAIAQSEDTTMYNVLLAMYTILLGKLGNSEDIIVGTPVAGRRHPDLENMVGMFVNTLPLRNYPKADITFLDFLRVVTEKNLSRWSNQDYPYEVLVSELNIKRDLSRQPLFDAMFSFQQSEPRQIELRGVAVAPYHKAKVVSKMDITLVGSFNGEDIILTFVYATALWDQATIDRFVSYFRAITRAVAAYSDVVIGDIEILPAEEKLLLIDQFNDTAITYPVNTTITRRFREQVRKTPAHTALAYGENFLTYQQLDELSDRMATAIRQKNVSARVVALYTEPSFDMVIGIWGILKSGMAFVPIDPYYSSARQAEILNDCQCDVLVTQQHLKDNLTFSGQLVTVDDGSLQDADTMNVESDNGDLVYVIYTSGSTGKPKGVKIGNKNLLNYVAWFERVGEVGPADKLIIGATYTFDAIYTQFFSALLNGAELHILPREVYQDAEKYLQYIDTEGISFLKCTPTVFGMLVNEAGFNEQVWQRMRMIMLGGENIHVKDLGKIAASHPHIRLMNHYGPTETTIGCVAQYIEPKTFLKRPTIGKPIGNIQCYILDNHKNLLPRGAKGELCIGGAGVGLGYWGLDALTAEKFIDNPYVPGERIYRTGDLARWTADGLIECLGRRDHQLKIRGFRIEPGEIESHLRAYPGIRDAVVSAIDIHDDRYLAAYYVSDNEIEKNSIHEYLLSKLPDYMIPTYYHRLDALPTTLNGKINRKALPDITTALNDGYSPPSNSVEHKLVEIWSDVLNVEKSVIGVDQNFFELGGHSLKATRLASRIRKDLNCDIALIDIFRSPTIKGLSSKVYRGDVVVNGSDLLTLLRYNPDSSGHLFFVHDGSGDVQGYIELAGTIETHTCWGLRSITLQHHAPQNLSISEIAAAHIALLKTVQPNGPYSLVGWSMGGTVAYEMAAQLESAGYTVTLIFMIDSRFSPSAEENGVPLRKEFDLLTEKRVVFDLFPDKVETLEAIDTVEALWRQVIPFLKEDVDALAKVKEKVPLLFRPLIPHFHDIEADDLVTYVNTIRTLELAAARYYPVARLTCPLAYIKAAESERDTGRIPDYFGSEVTFLETGGSHFTMLQLPNVFELSKKMKLCLQQCERAGKDVL